MNNLTSKVEQYTGVFEEVNSKTAQLNEINKEIEALSLINDFYLTFEQFVKKGQLLEYKRLIEGAIYKKGNVHFDNVKWATDFVTSLVEGLEDNQRLQLAWNELKGTSGTNEGKELYENYSKVFEQEKETLILQRSELLASLEVHINERQYSGLTKLMDRYDPKMLSEQALKQVAGYEKELKDAGRKLNRNYIAMKYSTSGAYIGGRFDTSFNQGLDS